MHLALLIILILIVELILPQPFESIFELGLQKKNAAAGRWKQGKGGNDNDKNANDKLFWSSSLYKKYKQVSSKGEMCHILNDIAYIKKNHNRF